MADRPVAPNTDPARDPTHVRSMHWAAFRSGEWAEILTIAPDPGDRSCYVVRFPDGATDFWVVDDPDGQYEFRAALAARGVPA